MSNICKIFGSNIKKWRGLRGLSQEKVAELLNFHLNTVGRFERGEHFCKPQTIEKLAKILQIKPSDLFETKSKKYHINDTDMIYKIGQELNCLTNEELTEVYHIIISKKNKTSV